MTYQFQNMNSKLLITIDPDILSGQPIFTGTRVPVETLFGHLKVGVSLDDFIDDFSTAFKEQAIAVLALQQSKLTLRHV